MSYSLMTQLVNTDSKYSTTPYKKRYNVVTFTIKVKMLSKSK